MERKIIVNTNCYHGYDIYEAIKGISAAGFKYVELTATKGWTEHVFFDHSFEQLQNVKDTLKEYGLIPYGFSGHTSLMDETRIKDFINNIHLANFFGSKFIITSVGEAHLEDVEKQGNDLIVKHLKQFVPILEDYDMQMAIEVHGDHHGTGVILKKIVEEVGSDRIGVAYDTANAVFYGNVDPADDLEKCIDKVSYIHIKDKAGERREWNFPALGEGVIDFEKFILVLDENNNQAPMSIEIEFTENGPKDIEEINDAIRTSKKYLEKLGYKI